MKKLSCVLVLGMWAVACGGTDEKTAPADCSDTECATEVNGETTDEASSDTLETGTDESGAATDGNATDATSGTATDDGTASDGSDGEPAAQTGEPEPTDTDALDEEPDAGAAATDPESAATDDGSGTDVGATDAQQTDAPPPDEVLTDETTTDEVATDETTTDEEVVTDETTDGQLPEDQPPFDAAPELVGQPDKVDLLFVIDNSLSMADKQVLFATALPDLVERLVNPNCRDAEGKLEAPDGAGQCAPGSALEFPPIADLHLGIITTSLGGSGAARDCTATSAESSEQKVDMGHLLGSLERGAAAVPSAAGSGFLSWAAGDDSEPLVQDFADLVVTAGEYGCGWEATLESWVRFLVDPYPYTRVTRQPCSESDTNNLCAGPEVDGDGNQLVDTTILAQRAEFLRPDSLLAVVMFSDESDCSFRASRQAWRFSQTVNDDGTFNPAFRGNAACDDPTMGANHECCTSCGVVSIPDGCPTGTMEDGTVVARGCEDGRRYGSDGYLDAPNLRCFQQKRRFGIDSLYPVERYSNALMLEGICPTNDDLSPGDCDVPLVRNPIFGLQDGARRRDNWVFLAGILGVPWQDIAVDPTGGESLRYRSNAAGAAERINWDWILGEFDPVIDSPVPDDPLMRESVAPRSGVNPATGVALAPASASYMANPINGHEWNIADNNDLQYACIFPLLNETDCLTPEEYQDLAFAGEAAPACDCTDFGDEIFANPVCQEPSDGYGLTQRYGKAYPGLRQLQVLRDFGDNSVVASICPKEMGDTFAPDFGYRPAVNALLERFRGALNP